MNTTPDPDERYKTPGQLLGELLTDKGWSQRVLAIILDEDETALNKLITGKKALSASLALKLGEVFGVPPERLLAIEKRYDLAQARLTAREDPARSKRAHLFGALPVSDMIKRGWIRAESVRDVAQVERELARFFRAPSTDEIEILPHAAKRTHVVGEANPSQMAWLYRVQHIAGEMLAPKYSESALRAALPKLSALLLSAEEARKVPRILSECGVRFLIVETLPGAKIDGVCFWLDDSSPVVALTLKYDRIDNFWFVLRHELEHVLHRHGKGAVMLDAELQGAHAGVGANVPEEERIANTAASEFCVPSKSMHQFLARKAPFFAERDILGFARSLNIHPGLVAGQLQHRTDRFDLFRAHLVKIRSIVAPSALVDGWGNVVPVDQ